MARDPAASADRATFSVTHQVDGRRYVRPWSKSASILVCHRRRTHRAVSCVSAADVWSFARPTRFSPASQNKDIHWYAKDADETDAAASRRAEIKKIKEQEEDALAVALWVSPLPELSASEGVVLTV